MEAFEDGGLGKSRGSACLATEAATEAAPHTLPLQAAVTSKVLQEPRQSPLQLPLTNLVLKKSVLDFFI